MKSLNREPRATGRADDLSYIGLERHATFFLLFLGYYLGYDLREPGKFTMR